MKNIAFVESVTDESGTDHRVRACINGVVLRGEWTSVEERATKQAASIRAMLAAAPSIPDAEGQVRQGLSEAWLPIESAPDETPVWLLSAAGDIWIGERNFNGDGWLWGNCYMTVYLRGDGTWGSSDCQEDDDYQPTHWMPLPAPPAHNIQPPKGEA